MQGRTEKTPERTGRWVHKQVPAGVPVPLARCALRRLPLALQGSGLTARPRARRGSGEESRVALHGQSVHLSVRPCESAAPGSSRRGGAGRGWPPGYRPLGPSSPRHLASALSPRSLGRGSGAEPPAAVGSGELAARQADRCLDTEAALRGARPSPDPSAESPLERRALSGWELERAPRLPTARPQGLGARNPAGSRPTPLRPQRLGQPPLESHGPSDTANLPGFS